jgi:hypothetical protein
MTVVLLTRNDVKTTGNAETETECEAGRPAPTGPG